MPPLTPRTDFFTTPSLLGHWHKTLELPCGYQHFNWYTEGENPHRVVLNDPALLRQALRKSPATSDVYLYTQHEIYLQEGILKHTRSSPNWEGGLVTYATCKHLMRSASRSTWHKVWLCGLCPRSCESNTVLFCGCIHSVFANNYQLGQFLQTNNPQAMMVKQALNNPRGDIYTPRFPLTLSQSWDHLNFDEPPHHTRSLEFYKKSPGSTSERPDGKIPKWWRDIEYLGYGKVHPPVFILQPCFLFSHPQLWVNRDPRRAVLRVTTEQLAQGLSDRPWR